MSYPKSYVYQVSELSSTIDFGTNLKNLNETTNTIIDKINRKIGIGRLIRIGIITLTKQVNPRYTWLNYVNA